jgi:hypothetical protein
MSYSGNHLVSHNSEIQAAIFPKNKYSPTSARNWLMANGLHAIKHEHETPGFYRYRIQDPIKYKRFITKKLPDSIELIIGYKE